MKRISIPIRITVLVLVVTLTSGCAAPPNLPVASTTVPPARIPTSTLPAIQPDFWVPPGEPPTIDGTLSPGEWDGARVETFSDGSELFLLYSGGYLYLGARGNKPELVAGNVYLDRGDEIVILHASAALGTAIYTQVDGGWERSQDFTWRCRATDDSPAAIAARDAFFEEERWVAANSYMGTPNELEYKIEVATPMLRLAVNMIRSSNLDAKLAWPAGLDDDTIRPAPGGLPPQLDFKPESWVTIGIPFLEAEG